MKIKVSIADDHPIVLNGLQKMLHGHPELELCSASKNGTDLLEVLQIRQPDVLLLDIQMPDMQGDYLTSIILKKYPGIRIIALTNMDQPFYVRNLLKNGAMGYLLKNTDIVVLTKAIQTVYQGAQYIDSSLQNQMQGELSDHDKVAKSPTLTKRELEILALISDEMTSPQIAKKLFVTLSTVENHRLNLFLKLNVKNVVGLVKKGIQLGLIK